MSAPGRRFEVDREYRRWTVRVDATDTTEGEFAPTTASAGVGTSNADGSAGTVLVIADRAQTLREIGEALIAAADEIDAKAGAS